MSTSEIKMKLSASVDHGALAAAKDTFAKAAARAVTVVVADEKPSLCIGCGAVRQPDGEMPCDH